MSTSSSRYVLANSIAFAQFEEWRIYIRRDGKIPQLDLFRHLLISFINRAPLLRKSVSAVLKRLHRN